MDWVTAARPRIDRCASAWLIKKFVDPGATFSFVATKKDVPIKGIPFDMPGVKHGHRGDMCTFETIVRDYKLGADAALAEVSKVVHDLDFHKFELPESAGLDAILAGLLLAEPNDHRVLEKATTLFDALYARAKARSDGGEP